MRTYDTYKDSGISWLGLIPSHWDMIPIRHILQLKKRIVGDKANLYTLLSLTLQGIIKRDLDNPKGKFPSSFDAYQVVEKNDFVFCNFDNEETPRAVGLSAFDGMITGAYDVFSCKNDNANIRFLNYYFLNIDEFKRFKPLYKGLRKSIPIDALLAYKVAMPPQAEQDEIVAYLDRGTAEIDKAIASQQRMVELLQERKQIIINQAVTQGLNPDAPMKPTNIDWLPQIPAHWEYYPLKYSLSLKARVGWKGLTSDEFLTEGYAYLVTGQDFIKADIEWSNCYQIDKKRYEEDPYIQLSNGDLLVTKDGTIGKVAIVSGLDKPACLNSGIFVVKQKKSSFIPEYLYWQLLSCHFTEFFSYNSTGSTIKHLYQNVFDNMPMLIPPLNEQRKIVQHIDIQTKPIDNAIEKCRSMIDLLTERKQILINDVVTGKIKV